MWPHSRRRLSREKTSHELVGSPPQSEISTNIPRDRLALVAAAVVEAVDADLEKMSEVFPLEEDRNWFTLWPGEHYAFLDGLTRVAKPALVLDIGTYHGASALVMASHTEKLVTYDIVPLHEIGSAFEQLTSEYTNVQQIVGDLSEHAFYESQIELITNSDLVLVDGPKDGVFEYALVPRLLQDMKEGSILVLDDIRFANMVELWKNLDRPRMDVGCFAHSSGTGVVFV